MKQGYLTVYLSLTLAILMSLIFTIVEGARYSAIRMRIETVTDMGMDSIFSEYHKELLNQYDLFFIDTSYQTASGSVYRTVQHLDEYMHHNFKPEYGEHFQFLYKDFLRLSASNLEAEEAAYATDDGAYVYKRQAVAYEKDKFGINYINILKDQARTVDENNWNKGNIRNEINHDLEKLKKKYEKKKHKKHKKHDDDDEEPDESKLKESTDILDTIPAVDIASFLVDQSKLSKIKVNESDYVSHRIIRSGCGLTNETEVPNGIVDEILFSQYLFDKFGCFTKQKSNGVLKYQLEYILCGRGKDIDNLNLTVMSLVQIRSMSNLMYLYSDSAKQNEVNLIAEIITDLLLIPEAKNLAAGILNMIWAYCEGIVDVKTLLDGGKVPLYKSKQTWNLSLLDLNVAMLSKGKSDEKTGISYQEYLRILLLLTSEQNRLCRSLDVIEMDIRNTEHNENFKIDNCIDYLKVKMSIISGFGPQFLITKKYRYF